MRGKGRAVSNNRLYVGNLETRQWVFIEKGWAAGWSGGWFVNERVTRFREFIAKDMVAIAEFGGRTNLVFFTEYDIALHHWFMRMGENGPGQKEWKPDECGGY